MGMVDQALERLGIVLPPAPRPVAAYVPFVQSGNLVFVSGQLPMRDGKLAFIGKVGEKGMLPEEAAQAARQCAINTIAVLRDACGGNLDRVKRIVRVGVFVQSADDFTGQSAVANGASELFAALFGDNGKHARAAVGTNALPLGAAVEVELLAEVA
jgi:enamine deaminase RidA (YjgF/YER057c/UK114 family)